MIMASFFNAFFFFTPPPKINPLEYESSARAPIHQYECLSCRAEHMYKPVHKTEGSSSSRRASSNPSTTPDLDLDLKNTQPPRNLTKMKQQQQQQQQKQQQQQGDKSWMKTISIQVVQGEKVYIHI
jgi:hypothetical protein